MTHIWGPLLKGSAFPDHRILECGCPADMRDLLDLAIEKGVRRFLSQAQRAGLMVPAEVYQENTDQERFDQQLGDLR